MIEQAVVDRFLAGHRIAVVGASGDQKSFGTTISKELRSRGYDVVDVHPTATEVHSLRDVKGELDGVVVMVNARAALQVVSDAIEKGVPRVWLFKGIGAPGSSSAEAVALCKAAGVEVVAGACPLMFLEPVGWMHRVHRSVRRAKHQVGR
jgi:predicted CoA-binding protein